MGQPAVTSTVACTSKHPANICMIQFHHCTTSTIKSTAAGGARRTSQTWHAERDTEEVQVGRTGEMSARREAIHSSLLT